VDDPDLVEKLSTLYDDLSAMALDGEGSAQLIADFAVRASEKEASDG
jgi:hypothetical protein